MKQLQLIVYLFIFIVGITVGSGVTYVIMDKDIEQPTDTTAEVIRDISEVESEREDLETNTTNTVLGGRRGRYE